MDTIITNNSDKVTNLLKRETDRQLDVEKKRNEKKLENAEHEQYNYFTQIFQDKLNEILTLLDSIPNVCEKEMAFQFDKISREIQMLQKFVTDSNIFLRGYDIRKCQQSLQEIETKARKLEEKLLPKKKFGFKHKRNTKQIQDNNALIDFKRNGHDEIDNSKKISILKYDDQFFGFQNRIDSLLNLSHDSLHKKDVTLHNLQHCVVILNGAPSTLHMDSLNNCVVLIGPVSTSVFVEHCHNCKLVVACQQLRLHDMQQCDIYLHVTSKAIIEDCNRISVAPYNYDYNTIRDDFRSACLDLDANHWDQLDDFNWLVLEKHSPNWTVLDEKSRITNWDEYVSTFF